MSKIRISRDTIELEGEILKKEVRKFGTSAHIPISKEHLGKQVYIVIPEQEGRYRWTLSKKELEEVQTLAREQIKTEEWKGLYSGYKRKHYQDSITSLKQQFTRDDLKLILNLLKKNKKAMKLVEKLKKAYSL